MRVGWAVVFSIFYCSYNAQFVAPHFEFVNSHFENISPKSENISPTCENISPKYAIFGYEKIRMSYFFFNYFSRA